MNTEPGVCALAGSAFITIWAPGKDPVTIDGNVTVPGSGLPKASRSKGAYTVKLDYGGGIETLVGPGSVSVPGSLAALDEAWTKYGRASWSEIFAPTIRATRNGFPLPAACHYYLQYSGDCIFGRSVDGHSALHDEHGQLRAPGSNIVVPHLADTMAQIAEEGARSFYAGDLARKMVTHVHDGGGMLTLDDLRNYHAIERACLSVQIGPWTIATNPPPAVGGAVLAAMLLACAELPAKSWCSESLALLVRAQRAALGYRKRNLDLADDVGLEAEKLLENLSVRSIQLQNIALLSMHCGLRADEIFSLRWNSVDIEKGLIFVKDSKGGSRTAFMTNKVAAMFAGGQLER